nr:SufE family protein [Arthrobacter sp. H5]
MIASLFLLGFSNELPELPEHYENHPDLFERVEECQAAVFIFVEVDDDNVVYLDATYLDATASRQAPHPAHEASPPSLPRVCGRGECRAGTDRAGRLSAGALTHRSGGGLLRIRGMAHCSGTPNTSYENIRALPMLALTSTMALPSMIPHSPRRTGRPSPGWMVRPSLMTGSSGTSLRRRSFRRHSGYRL